MWHWYAKSPYRHRSQQAIYRLSGRIRPACGSYSLRGNNDKENKTAEGGHPTLRAEREALSLLHFLRDHDKPQSEWLNAITSDQTLSPPRRIRQRALQFAREWQP